MSKFAYTGRENLEAMTEAKNYNRYLIEFVKKSINKKHANLLDFGAGSGTYADLLKNEGIVVDCLEPDETLQKQLRNRKYKVLKNINELKSNSYDVIYALNVLEHIEDDKKTVAQLTKALKPTGKLVIYVPAFQALFTAMDKKVGHYRRYKKNRLRLHAEDAGLKINELYYCDPLGFGAAIAFKYIGNKEGEISASAVKFYDRVIFPLSRAIEPIFKKFIGKNVVLIAEK